MLKMLSSLSLLPSLIALLYLGCLGAVAEEPRLLLANVYSGQVVLQDYWVSEKLDGVRGYWDGKKLISRQGNPIEAPAWFTRDFPEVPLDGELWIGRGNFERVSGIIRQGTPHDNLWRNVRFMVFDLPCTDLTFDQRLPILKQLIDELAIPHLQIVHQYRVNDHGALMRELEEVVRGGGEGLMLHRGGSYYRAGRSDDLLKVKMYEDAEAIVVAHLPGKGKYRGLMGALLVELPDGRRFKIGTGFSDYERANPPAVGSTITYKYFGKTSKDIPRFASFLRVREEGM